MGSYLHARHISTNRLATPQMVKYHGKGRGKIYAPIDRALFVSLRMGIVCHRVGLEFIVKPYNPYRFSRQFGYTPTIPGLSSSAREIVDLPTGLRFWCACILSGARQTVTFPGNSSPHTPPASYKTWLSKLFPSEAPRSSSVKHGKALVFVLLPWVTSLVRRSPEGVTPSVVPDSVIKDQVVEVSSSVSSQERTQLVDTGESPKFLAIEVVESCLPSLPTLTFAQGAKVILRTGASSLWTCICNGLQGKSLEMVLKERESFMETFKVLSQMGLGDFSDLHIKLQVFFRRAREMVAASAVVSHTGTSETLQKLSLLKMTFEDQTSKTQGEVQKIEKLE
ncbi:hypothetical protein LIER_28669 [Lithospermum erythrorhizon]|uniref:Uncharacterized protein n=1 Tax=Lithospermum erythrorhizon TaxID=34254 RepID=A0AAV3RHL3_LITER